jgi:putative hydrolase of the HAD superfamily
MRSRRASNGSVRPLNRGVRRRCAMGNVKRVLVFDIDGVLVEPWGFSSVLQDEHKIPRALTQDFFLGPFQPCLSGKANLEEVLPPYLKAWQWAGSIDDFIRLWLEADDRPSGEAFKAVESIRRPEDICCVASNQERLRARYISEDMGFSTRFDRLYFSCDLGVTKPARDYYGKIQNDLDVSPNQVFFWDDSQSHVDAATNLGWNAFLYDGPRSITAPPAISSTQA